MSAGFGRRTMLLCAATMPDGRVAPRRSTEGLRAGLAVIFLAGVLASCSGGDAVSEFSRAGTTDEQPADTAGNRSAVVPDDLSGELLGPGDL